MDALGSCCGVQFPQGPMLLPYHVPLQLSGERSRTQREVGPWNSLGEGSMGRRKEREHGDGVGVGDGLLAVQMQYSFPSVTSELPTVVI